MMASLWQSTPESDDAGRRRFDWYKWLKYERTTCSMVRLLAVVWFKMASSSQFERYSRNGAMALSLLQFLLNLSSSWHRFEQHVALESAASATIVDLALGKIVLIFMMRLSSIFVRGCLLCCSNDKNFYRTVMLRYYCSCLLYKWHTSHAKCAS